MLFKCGLLWCFSILCFVVVLWFDLMIGLTVTLIVLLVLLCVIDVVFVVVLLDLVGLILVVLFGYCCLFLFCGWLARWGLFAVRVFCA